MAKVRNKMMRAPGQVQLRIIGGAWRGRRLSLPAVAGLRPTPDRVRETLFNWLQGHVENGRCLDLFAGSGALGLEALSRGASCVVFVDLNRLACTSIDSLLSDLDAGSRACVACSDANSWLANYTGAPFDLVFIDPPYASDLAELTLEQLDSFNLLARDARIYLEQSSSAPPTALPQGWQIHREKSSGQVRYQLIMRL